MSRDAAHRVHDSPEALKPVSAEARRLGIHPRQLRRAIQRGQLRGYRVGAWLRLRTSDVDAWLEAQRYRPEDQTGFSAPAERDQHQRRVGKP